MMDHIYIVLYDLYVYIQHIYIHIHVLAWHVCLKLENTHRGPSDTDSSAAADPDTEAASVTVRRAVGTTLRGDRRWLLRVDLACLLL